MHTPKRNFRSGVLVLVMATFGLASTWADEKVTIRKDADGNVTIRHEGVDDDILEDNLRVTVKTAPPQPKDETEVVETKPGDDYVWVPGYWRWNSTSGEYEWVSGVWRKKIPSYTWISGKWIKVGDEYVWQPGYWAPEGRSELIIAKEAPPEPREETQGAAPGSDYVWIPGYWAYEDGEYKWITGRWEKPIREGMTWVPGKWVKTASGYTYIPGRWDYTVETRTYIVRP